MSFDTKLPALLKAEGVYTLSAGLLRAGELVWSGVYGERTPGQAADRRSLFNTASVSKAVTAETVLRLVERGDFSLDAPLAEHWTDPDLADDPRHEQLTPRIVLAHRTGFPNWRYLAEDGKLAFEADPGVRFGYSGEGFEYLRRYVEAKLGQPFEEVVQEVLFDPLAMTESSVVARDWMAGRMVMPRSADDGSLLEPNANPPGSANAADDFFTTVEDYAKLLASLAEGEAKSGLAVEKMTIQSDASTHEHWICEPIKGYRCPSHHGFGLGWLVFEWGEQKLVWHGGNDATEHAIGYIDPASGEGAIVFVNGAAGLPVMLDALDLIDPEAPLTDFYRALFARLAGG